MNNRWQRGQSASKRQCARAGCNAVATATYTFDSATCTVWLDTPFEGAARAGELCERHARSLKPPRGWQVDDRRPDASSESSVRADPIRDGAAAPATAPAAPPGESRGAEHPSRGGALFAAASGGVGSTRAALDDELRGLLDAHSPLLARAFRSSGSV